ncbi:MAG: hypothetical protein ACYDA9_07155 [Terriglobia bacterium]
MVTSYQACWERNPSATADDIKSQEGPRQSDAYRLARAVLVLACDDEAFRFRFQEKFAECAYPPEARINYPQIRCEIRTHFPVGISLVSFSDPELLDPVAFALSLFPDGEYVQVLAGDDEWQLLASRSNPSTPVLAFRGNEILVDRSHSWQAIIAQYAVSNVMRLQEDVLFFHAASLALRESGVMISGAKGAGKTTLSLTLASRGHGFLGDEYAALCAQSGEMIPMRTSAPVRNGPRTPKLQQYFTEHECESEVSVDGTRRVRARVSDIFPEARPRYARLTHVFFLRQFSTDPRVEAITPQARHLSLLSPLAPSLWETSPGHRAIEFLKLLANAQCFYLDVGGSPDETADLVEKTVEESWV